MKTLVKISILFLLCSFNLIAQDEDDLKIMKMMNDLRKEQGVKPLKFHSKLDSIADAWVKYIADSLKNLGDEEIHSKQEKDMKYLHIDFDKRATVASLTKEIIMTSISENIAFSSGNVPENVVYASFNAWKKSLPHYKGMINSSYSHFGFSVLKLSNGRVLYLTVFARVIK